MLGASNLSLPRSTAPEGGHFRPSQRGQHRSLGTLWTGLCPPLKFFAGLEALAGGKLLGE